MTTKAMTTMPAIPKKWIAALACVLSITSHAQAPVSISISTSSQQLSHQLLSQPTPQPGQAVTSLPNGQWLLTGGQSSTSTASNTVSLIDANGKITVLTSQLTQARSNHSATLMPNGMVLILGGTDAAGNVISTAEQYNPTTNTFTAVGSLGLIPRSGQSATVLSDGRLLIVGGIDVNGLPEREIELYNQQCQPCNPQRYAVGLDTARQNATAALLPNGTVLLWGGTSNGQPLNNGDLADPGSQTITAVTQSNAQQLAQTLTTTGTPGVNSSQPAVDAVGIAVDQPLMVRFGQSMALSSLNSNTVTLIGPNGQVAIKPIPLQNGTLLFVTPSQNLLPATRYTLFISGATTPSGQALPFTAIGFTTAQLNGQSSTGPLITPSSSSNTNTNNTSTTIVSTTPATTGTTNTTGGAATPLIQADIDEIWTPQAANYHGIWTSNRSALAQQHPPRRVELQRSYRLAEMQHDGRIKPAQREALLPQIRQAAAAPGVTALVGQTLKLNGQPLAGVTVSMGNQRTVTDDNGEFLLTNIPSGFPPGQSPMMEIDGRSASNASSQYGRYFYTTHIRPGQVNAMQQPIWMTKLDTAHAVNIASPTVKETVITNPQLPGLEVHLPAGAVIRDADGNIVTQVSLTPVPSDQLPFPMPYGQIPVYYTLQPGGAVIESATGKPLGAKVVYPNYSTQPPGAKFDLFDYDPKGRGWYIYGTASVAADGKHMNTDKDFVLYQFTASSYASGGGIKGTAGYICKKCLGDPVSLYDGTFVENDIDLAIDDLVPLTLNRSYHSGDTNQHSFGIGSSNNYDAYLYIGAPVNNALYSASEFDLVMGDGTDTVFLPVSSNTTYIDPTAIWQSTTPGPFYMAQLHVTSGDGSNFLVTLKDGTIYSFSYYQSILLSIQDRWGNTVAITRDNQQRMIEATSQSGHTLIFQYNSANCSSCITQVTDNIGRQVSYEYDSLGNLIQVKDAAGGITTYTHDPQTNNVLTVNDPRNNAGQITQPKVTNTYYGTADGANLNGKVKQQTYADGSTYQFAYTFDANGNVTQATTTDPRGNIRNTQFNTEGQITQAILAQGQPEQQTISNVWNSSTNLLQSTTDTLLRQTAYTYDAMGNVLSVTALAGTANASTISYTYTSTFNQLASITDQRLHTTTFTHDSLGNLTQVTDANNNAVTITPMLTGQIAAVTDALGHATSLVYDGAALVRVTDALTHSVNITRDGAGRATQISDSLGNATQITPDSFDRTKLSVDALKQPTTFNYDPDGNLTQVADAKTHNYGYSFDSRNNLSGYTDPLLQTTSYQHDPNRNLTQQKDRKGQVTTVIYDHLDRPITITFADNSTITNTYDAVNRITQIADSQNGTIGYSYDGLNRLTSVTTATSTISYTYYLNGLRNTMTVAGQPTITYTYDPGNRLTQISQAAGAINNNTAQTITYAYDIANRLTQKTLPNGIAMNYVYDNANHLTGITYTKGATTLGNLTYGYDVAGHRAATGGTFARMNAMAPNSGNTLDASNRLTSFNGTTMQYDANGNLINDGTNTYTWNARNQLTAINGATTATFTYDATGRRQSKTIDGVTSTYIYDGANIIGETNSGTTYLTGLGIDETLAIETGSNSTAQVDSYLTDSLNSTIRLTDNNGNKLVDYTYDIYGVTTADANVNNPFQYTGRENDGTGLYYYRARYYSSAQQRFISQDPIGLEGGIDPYAYVGGNPLQFSDPFGLQMSIPGGYGPISANEGAGYAAQQQMLPNYPTGVGIYGFYSKTGTIPTPIPGVQGAVEVAKIVGYDTKKGFTNSELAALGVEIGNHDSYAAVFGGVELSDDGCEAIVLAEGQVGLGIPWVAGGAAGLGSYVVPKSGETGAFVFVTPRALNAQFSVGLGINIYWKY